MTGPVDLDHEMGAAVRALNDDQRTQLIAAGVDRIDLALGMVGVARGRLGKFNLFEPDPDGALTYLCPVRIDPTRLFSIETPIGDSAVRFGDLVDIAPVSVRGVRTPLPRRRLIWTTLSSVCSRARVPKIVSSSGGM
jgi:hypothetical protein